MTSPRPPGRRPTPPLPQRPSTALGSVPPKPQNTRSLVEQIVADQKQSKVEVEKAISKRTKTLRIAPYAAAILLVSNLVVWLIFPPKRDTRGDRRSPSEIDRDLRLVVASAASNIEIWRRVHDGQIPSNLIE